MKSLFSLAVLVLLLACDKKQDEIKPGGMQAYVDRFFAEADEHHYIFSQPNVTLRFVTEESIAPYSGYGTPDPPTVSIVETRWEKFTDVQKEILMFHELGHAMLRRQHTDELLPNCDYKSMMMDGNQFSLYDDNSIKREYYIDELFDRNAPYPDWGGKIGPNKTVLVSGGSSATFTTGINSSHTGTMEEDGSLHINGDSPETEQASWKIIVPTLNIPAGATVIAKFKMKLSDVGGDGVRADFHADYNSDIDYYTSTSFYEQYIVGTSDYTEYTLILNCYPEYRPDISFFLIFAGSSTGDVWIKDVEVAYYN